MDNSSRRRSAKKLNFIAAPSPTRPINHACRYTHDYGTYSATVWAGVSASFLAFTSRTKIPM
jgi:hypothetical protein